MCLESVLSTALGTGELCHAVPSRLSGAGVFHPRAARTGARCRPPPTARHDLSRPAASQNLGLLASGTGGDGVAAARAESDLRRSLRDLSRLLPRRLRPPASGAHGA